MGKVCATLTVSGALQVTLPSHIDQTFSSHHLPDLLHVTKKTEYLFPRFGPFLIHKFLISRCGKILENKEIQTDHKKDVQSGPHEYTLWHLTRQV